MLKKDEFFYCHRALNMKFLLFLALVTFIYTCNGLSIDMAIIEIPTPGCSCGKKDLNCPYQQHASCTLNMMCAVYTYTMQIGWYNETNILMQAYGTKELNEPDVDELDVKSKGPEACLLTAPFNIMNTPGLTSFVLTKQKIAKSLFLMQTISTHVTAGSVHSRSSLPRIHNDQGAV